MKLEDALFNWLQIRLVADARPDDGAARDTESFFAEILRDDHHLQQVQLFETDDTIGISFELNGTEERRTYSKEHAMQLLADIEANPKYN